ncbi:MAG: hypothetical protein IT208_00855 [Chthonomonadales bacterium]|nr:hypothetical protein [Chthonomonadales bacterium]
MRKGLVVALALGLTLTVGSVAGAQGRGRGMGYGMGRGMGYGMGRGMGAGPGAGVRMGGGGWWARVTPTTPEQKALVDQVAALHTDIRAANLEVAKLRATSGPAARIAERERVLVGLREQLRDVTTRNATLMRQMGVPAGYGICDGTGPKADCPLGGPGMRRGNGWGLRNGWGRANGWGLRNGTGPNPNCPLK